MSTKREIVKKAQKALKLKKYSEESFEYAVRIRLFACLGMYEEIIPELDRIIESSAVN